MCVGGDGEVRRDTIFMLNPILRVLFNSGQSDRKDWIFQSPCHGEALFDDRVRGELQNGCGVRLLRECCGDQKCASGFNFHISRVHFGKILGLRRHRLRFAGLHHLLNRKPGFQIRHGKDLPDKEEITAAHPQTEAGPIQEPRGLHPDLPVMLFGMRDGFRQQTILEKIQLLTFVGRPLLNGSLQQGFGLRILVNQTANQIKVIHSEEQKAEERIACCPNSNPKHTGQGPKLPGFFHALFAIPIDGKGSKESQHPTDAQPLPQLHHLHTFG